MYIETYSSFWSKKLTPRGMYEAEGHGFTQSFVYMDITTLLIK